MSHHDTPHGILLIGFEPAEAARVALTLAEAGHRGHPARSARETIETFAATPIDLALVDLTGAFAEVLGAVEAVRAGGRQRCPVLGLGSASTCAAITDALRALGFEGLVPRGASPQELIFRVNRVLYAERQAANRVSPRVPVNLPASFDGLEGPGQGQILNLSETGLFLSTDQLLPVDRSVTVRFPLAAGKDPIIATCRVVWGNAGGEGQRYFRGMGLQFLRMRPADREELRSFIAEALAGLDAETAGTVRATAERYSVAVAAHGSGVPMNGVRNGAAHGPAWGAASYTSR